MMKQFCLKENPARLEHQESDFLLLSTITDSPQCLFLLVTLYRKTLQTSLFAFVCHTMHRFLKPKAQSLNVFPPPLDCDACSPTHAFCCFGKTSREKKKKSFHLKYSYRKKINSSFDIDISRIGNTFIRTLTHACFLARLEACVSDSAQPY